MDKEVPSSLKGIRRKTIRYVLFAKKAEWVDKDPPIDPSVPKLTREQWDDIVRYYYGDKDFKAIDFPERWDIGIDDLDTMVNRGEKFWLFGISRFTRVRRPTMKKTLWENGEVQIREQLWPETETFAIEVFNPKGFCQEVSHGNLKRLIPDYNRILETMANRQTWLEV